MLPLTEGGSERHERTGSKTAVVLGASDRERPGWLARMRTAQVQAAARVQIPLLCDSGETPAPSPTAPSWWTSRASGPSTWATPSSPGRATCLGPTPGRRRRPQATRGSRWSRPAARDILADVQTELHKMAHCCERRDPNFEAKTRDAPPPREQLSFREDEALSGHRLEPLRVRVRA